MLSRREFSRLALFGLAMPAAGKTLRFLFAARGNSGFMNTDGRTGMMNVDGTGLRYLEMDYTSQFLWQPGAFFSDGRRMILTSMEKGDFAGRSFSDYYHKIRTHLWIYDLDRGTLEPIAEKNRIEPFYTASSLLPGEKRFIVQVLNGKGGGRLFSMDLDGGNAVEIVGAGQGFPYGATVSPDGKRLAFHLAGPAPHSYRVFTSNLDGSDRVLVAGQPGHLYFGYAWSGDGKWLLYQDCQFRSDPGHDWSDIGLGRADGSGQRTLTEGQSHWFAASYGKPGNEGGGSNMPQWSPDGKWIAFSRKLPGSKTPWEIQPQRPDTTHFNRDYKPEAARGGTEICLLSPETGEVRRLTHSDPSRWDFRAEWSPDGRRILFCRAETGNNPAVWIMDSDGGNARQLTQGIDGRGAEFPKWVPG
jgi:Tol biopolymer transport system component